MIVPILWMMKLRLGRLKALAQDTAPCRARLSGLPSGHPCHDSPRVWPFSGLSRTRGPGPGAKGEGAGGSGAMGTRVKCGASLEHPRGDVLQVVGSMAVGLGGENGPGETPGGCGRARDPEDGARSRKGNHLVWAMQGSTTPGTPRWREEPRPGRMEKGPSEGRWGAERLLVLLRRRV